MPSASLNEGVEIDGAMHAIGIFAACGVTAAAAIDRLLPPFTRKLWLAGKSTEIKHLSMSRKCGAVGQLLT